ncbi:TetR/AcrR family transcriptional regulator [Saccharopolyspora griseoalba]|uniref:TetR/AcrR family transcriptional regulator n=1 Tax=Saccharopolyspora griseoalba TaxID=1431848 RepID=A0ABW2LJI1_9PSEU
MVNVARWVDSTVRRRSAKEALASDARRAQIVLAAVEAVDEIGPQVGMAQVADRAGLPRPNVYRHFTSKEQLDAEVTRFAATELIRRVRPHLSRAGTPFEVVRGIVAASIAWAAEHPNLYRFIAAQQQTKALHRARMGRTRFLDEIVEAMRAYLRTAEVAAEPPDGVLAGLMGMVDASIVWWLDHQDETEDQLADRVARQVAAVLIEVLAQLGIEIPDDEVFRP